MGRNTTTWIACGLLIVSAIAFMVIGDPEKALGLEDYELGRLVTGVALLLVIGSSMSFGFRGQGSQALKQAVVWLGFMFLLVVVYTYEAEFTTAGLRVWSQLVPGTPITLNTGSNFDTAGGVVAVTANQSGHFSISTTVNGTYVEMILDTGATQVVLTDFDARRIGINMDELKYTIPVKTANGETHTAGIRLDDVSVGPISVDRVRALIAKPEDLTTSLLGMSFLKSLSSFEIKGDQVILRR